MDITPSDTGMSYAYWRTDKEQEKGFSHELISNDTARIPNADLDTLDFQPFPGVNTLYKGMMRNMERIPNHDMLGTRVGDTYEWNTWREVLSMAEDLSHGMMALELAPEVQAEGKTWRFMGIQSKNRKEWVITNIAGMFQKLTTVALYDTLGPDATYFVCN